MRQDTIEYTAANVNGYVLVDAKGHTPVGVNGTIFVPMGA